MLDKIEIEIVIREIRDRADSDIQIIADAVVATEISPWIISKSMRYITGNGAWLILTKNGTQIDDAHLPERIRRWMHVDDGSGLPLGLRLGDIGGDGYDAAP